jgi:hypothetical protein
MKETGRIGFPDFQKEVVLQLGPLLTSATSFIQVGRDMFSGSPSGELPLVVSQIAMTVSNSMESVLILVSNGCGADAFRIARTMFESGVTVHYLEGHPELVSDYVDFIWVKRKKHLDYLLKFAPLEAKRQDQPMLKEVEAEFQRVKGRFTDRKGKIRNSWLRANLKAMAEEIKAISMYEGMYGFPSSVIHTDVLGLIAGSGDSSNVDLVPSKANLVLALRMGIVSYAMTLTALNQVAKLGFDERLDGAFSELKQAST